MCISHLHCCALISRQAVNICSEQAWTFGAMWLLRAMIDVLGSQQLVRELGVSQGVSSQLVSQKLVSELEVINELAVAQGVRSQLGSYKLVKELVVVMEFAISQGGCSQLSSQQLIMDNFISGYGPEYYWAVQVLLAMIQMRHKSSYVAGYESDKLEYSNFHCLIQQGRCL